MAAAFWGAALRGGMVAVFVVFVVGGGGRIGFESVFEGFDLKPLAHNEAIVDDKLTFWRSMMVVCP